MNTGRKDILGNYSNNDLILIRQTECFDWYQTYTGIKEVITQYMTKSDKIINLSSGNSSILFYINTYFIELSEDMYEEGYQNITNVDFSQICTEFMINKNKEKYPNMICK